MYLYSVRCLYKKNYTLCQIKHRKTFLLIILKSFIVSISVLETFQGKNISEGCSYLCEGIKKGGTVEGLDEKTKSNLQQMVSAATLNDKYINLMNMFLDYSCQCGKLEKNPLKGRRVKSKEEVNSFRPFSNIELETIFSKEIFSEKEITDGKYFKYWMPILGLYTGARINELAQLRLKDIQKENGIYYLNITDSEETIIKNSASRRYIAVHPDSIRLGFLKYIEWLTGKKEFFYCEVSNTPSLATYIC